MKRLVNNIFLVYILSHDVAEWRWYFTPRQELREARDLFVAFCAFMETYFLSILCKSNVKYIFYDLGPAGVDISQKLELFSTSGNSGDVSAFCFMTEN